MNYILLMLCLVVIAYGIRYSIQKVIRPIAGALPKSLRIRVYVLYANIMAYFITSVTQINLFEIIESTDLVAVYEYSTTLFGSNINMTQHLGLIATSLFLGQGAGHIHDILKKFVEPTTASDSSESKSYEWSVSDSIATEGPSI